MGVVTSIKEQRRVAEAADRVGGYDQLVRLAREKRTAPKGAKLVKNPESGQWSYQAKQA